MMLTSLANKYVGQRLLLTAFFLSATMSFGQQNGDITTLKKAKPIFTTNLNKGDYFVGGTISLSTQETNNRDVLIYNIDNENSADFSVRFDGGYAIKDNVFVGFGVQYGETKRKGNYVDSDNSSSYKRFYSNTMSYRPFIKNYVPLSESRRFNLITQTELSFGITQSIRQTEKDNDIIRTFSKQFDFGVSIRPGLLVFVVDNFAIETTVNVGGIKYSYLKQTTTLQPNTVVKKGSIDLKIDILQINLGFFVYL